MGFRRALVMIRIVNFSVKSAFVTNIGMENFAISQLLINAMNEVCLLISPRVFTYFLGSYINGRCLCQGYFFGPACQYVGKCVYGTLQLGLCVCEYGYEGVYCDQVA